MGLMENHFINTQPRLDGFCRKAADGEWISLDTEFMRVRTYYARLCLVQISDDQDIACVDPLADGLDLAPLRALLANHSVTKVVHAARQDLEVLWQTFRALPEPLFDTQVAAALLGHGDQVGYASLVESLVGKSLDKAHTRTDWCERPLTREQVEYALDDVRYLGELYRQLRAGLLDRGRLEWAFEECAMLTQPRLYDSDPQQAYLRMGQGHRLSPTQQHILKHLAVWRESVAQTRDLPRSWVAKDKLLVNIALAAPRDAAVLAAVDDMPQAFLRRHGKRVLELVAAVIEQGPTQPVWGRRDRLSAAERRLADRLLAVLNLVAEQQQIAAPLLGTRRDMEALARGDRGVPQLQGWRRQLLSEQLLRALDDTGMSAEASSDRSMTRAV